MGLVCLLQVLRGIQTGLVACYFLVLQCDNNSGEKAENTHFFLDIYVSFDDTIERDEVVSSRILNNGQEVRIIGKSE